MNVTAINSIYLNEDTGGKGRFFKSRFLQAGLVKYQFGVCLLKKETIDKFVNTFIGCPVVINHQDVTDESAKEQRVGVISRVYFDASDAWFWCEGVLFDNEAIDLVQKGYTVSCQYEITEYSDNPDGIYTTVIHTIKRFWTVDLNTSQSLIAQVMKMQLLRLIQKQMNIRDTNKI